METKKITRLGLKELHDIACNTWKNKLEEIGGRSIFSDVVEVTDYEIKQMFEAATDVQKEVLKKYFTIPIDIKNKIKSYEDACNLLSIEIKERSSFERLKIFIKALNEGWVPDFNNYNQYKYFSYFEFKNGEFVFGADCDCWSMDMPSALYLKSYELAKYVAIIAEKEYKEFYLNMCI